MQRQKSENEVEREKMGALIEIEKQRAGLIKEKTANEKAQAAVDGEARHRAPGVRQGTRQGGICSDVPMRTQQGRRE